MSHFYKLEEGLTRNPRPMKFQVVKSLYKICSQNKGIRASPSEFATPVSERVFHEDISIYVSGRIRSTEERGWKLFSHFSLIGLGFIYLFHL